jgi:predicted PurR-regulated permease PerM
MATRAEGPSVGVVARITVTVLVLLLLAYGAYRVRSTLILVFVAAFLAVGLDPAVRRLEGLRLSRGQAVAVIFIATLLFIVGFIAAVVPPLVRQIAEFAGNLPDYVQELSRKYPTVQRWVQENDIAGKLRDATQNAPSIIGGSFGKVVGVAGSVASSIFSTLTVMVLTIYFSLSLGRIRAGTLRLIPASKRDRVSSLMDPILEKVGAYIAGNITISLIAGALSFIFLSIAGVPYPIALALWVAIADLIPLVGATLGAVPAVIVAFFSSIPLGIATLVFFIAYQQGENYLIAPRVMNKAVDVAPAAVLLAALIGAGLLGFVGALIAIPAAAAIKIIANEVIFPKVEAA